MMPSDAGQYSKSVYDREFVERNLGFYRDDKDPLGRKYILAQTKITEFELRTRDNPFAFETTSDYTRFFGDAQSMTPEPIVRPNGDTTLFTTAGIQRIESMQRDGIPLERGSFVVAQPVIRSQFFDRACDGTSSAFVNLSVEDIRSTPQKFIQRCQDLIHLICCHGASPNDLRFIISTNDETWGKQNFHNIAVKVHYGTVELAECLYIYDYPVSESDRIGITDLGFGVERLRWGVWAQAKYLPEFNSVYDSLSNVDSNKVSAIIDTIRCMTLMAGEGVVPSPYNHGNKFRKLSKKFLERTRGLQVDIEKLITLSYESWLNHGYIPPASFESIMSTIIGEYERNFNAMFIAKLIQLGLKGKVETNQSTASFLRQMRFSISGEIIKLILSEIS